MNTRSDTLFVVTIDTEEDNWGQHRSGLRCDNIREIPKLQKLCEKYGILPTYLVSYQICKNDWAVDILKTYLDHGKCEIGAHLHPWNTPPEDEEMTTHNSFMKNLPYTLQLEKLQILTAAIEKAFEKRPTSFRTGRWGLGKETVDALLACGYQVDSSVTPTLSWESEGGPVYPDTETDPYLLKGSQNDIDRCLVEIPASIGFNRWPFSVWKKIYDFADSGVFKPLHLVGILNRTSLLQKLWLTPEGYSAGKMIRLATVLLEHEKQILNLSFHSNTLLPGATPFVKNREEGHIFYQKLEKLFEFLTQNTAIRPTTLESAGRVFLENRNNLE